MRDFPPQGSIGDIFLPRLVATLHLQEFEGALRLTFPDATKVIYFKRGEIASAASNAEPDRLANILIREARLSIEQLDLARSRLQPGASLGKTLIEMGFLTPSELLQGARRQVRIIVGSCFSAAEGAYEMAPEPLPPEVTSLGLNTRRLVFDCLMEAGDRTAVIREIGSMESVYRPTERLAPVLAALRLDFETDRIGRMLDGSATLRDISSRTAHDDLTVGKVILALDLLGAAENATPAVEAVVGADRGRMIPIRSEVPETPPAGAAVEDAGADDDAVTIIDEAPETPPPEVVAPVDENPAASAGPAAASVAMPPDSAPVDEPPPVPAEELPAFARPLPEAPPPEEPQWQIDPRTGERVHVGPIEMTFDGQVAGAGREPRDLTRFLIVAGAAAFVVAAAFGYVILRREPPEHASNASPPAGPASPPGETAGTARPAESSRTVASPAASPPGPAHSDAPGRAAPLIPGPVAPARNESLPAVSGTTPSPVTRAPAPAREQPAGATAPARPSDLPGDPAYAAALLRLDQGDPAGAARLFQQLLLSRGPRGATLQLMIACQEDTVNGARNRAGAHGALIVLPYSLKGRPCYRVCWGVYDGSDAARATIPDLPADLLQGTEPIVVPLARLRASE